MSDEEAPWPRGLFTPPPVNGSTALALENTALKSEIARLKAEVERMRSALEDIAYPNPVHGEDQLMQIARAALTQEKTDV